MADRPRVDDVVVLSNGDFATLRWNGGANEVSVVTADGAILKGTFVTSANGNTSSKVARDIASLANGHFVIVGDGGSRFKKIFARIYDNSGTFVTEITPITFEGSHVVGVPCVAALPDDGFVVMFAAGSGRYLAQLFDADGTRHGAPNWSATVTSWDAAPN